MSHHIRWTRFPFVCKRALAALGLLLCDEMKQGSACSLPSSFLEWEPCPRATQEKPADAIARAGAASVPRPVRVVPHSEGRWAGHLYFRARLSSACLALLSKFVAALHDRHAHLNFVLLDIASELHISVSQTFYLQHHLLEAFTRDIQAAVAHVRSFSVHVGESVEYFTNETLSRDFLSLAITQGSASLERVVQCVDRALERFCLPLFYRPPRFHCSFAWSTPEAPLAPGLIAQIQAQFLALGFAPQSLLLDRLLLRIGSRIIEARLA